MRWSAKKRIEFIEARLFWEGQISRKDLTDFFGISVPQATKDIKKYAEISPNNIRYDSSAKHYVASENFKPEISVPSSDRYLSRLRLIKGPGSKTSFFNGTIPPFSEMPQFSRFVDTEILRSLLKAIHNEGALRIEYQSMSSTTPKIRWITPHSLGNNGARWHARSLCHNDKIYKDFILGRILRVIDTVKNSFDHKLDYEWHNQISITIAPHSSLQGGQKSCVERDYGMVDGQVTLDMKAAFFYYFKVNFGLNEQNENMQCYRNQIQLLNLDEINAKLELLKTMSKTRIKEMEQTGKYLFFKN